MKKLKDPPNYSIPADFTLFQMVLHLAQQLEWKEIEVIPRKGVKVVDFFKQNVKSNIGSIVLPGLQRRTLLSFATEYDNAIEAGIMGIVKHEGLLQEEKLNQLYQAYNECNKLSSFYDFSNPFRFSFGMKMCIKNKNGTRTSIPMQEYELTPENLRDIRAELEIRKLFFEWVGEKIYQASRMVEFMAVPESLIKWNVTASEIKLVEIIWALESSETISFINEDAKRRFRKLCEQLFCLPEIDWNEKESDIRKRNGNVFNFLSFLKESRGPGRKKPQKPRKSFGE